MSELPTNDCAPEAKGIHFDFPMQIVNGAVSHDREQSVETMWRDLLMFIDSNDASNGFASDDAFAFASQNLESIFLGIYFFGKSIMDQIALTPYLYVHFMQCMIPK